MSCLYVHIPFCHHKCIYCSFFSVASKKDLNPYTDALLKEIDERKNFIAPQLRTIYFGGGTPSLLTTVQLEKIFTKISNTFDISHIEEITFEINGEDAHSDYLKELKTFGVNRLSIGVQSFNDRDLKFLNRSHTALQSERAIENAKTAGFENISIDLICNLPVSDFKTWKNNIDTFLSLDIPHVSCYTLMIDEGTMLYKLIEKGKYSPVAEDEALKQWDYAMQTLTSAGYTHYETSSYAKHGMISKHNTAYWTFEQYLGIGAGAHSYNNDIRVWNNNDIGTYIDYYSQQKRYLSAENLTQSDTSMHLNDGFRPENIRNQERLSIKDKYNEYVMLSARMDRGLKTPYVENNFPRYADHFKQTMQKLVRQGFFYDDYSLTNKGWHLQDTIILELAV